MIAFSTRFSLQFLELHTPHIVHTFNTHFLQNQLSTGVHDLETAAASIPVR